jgi:hypothetical protein
MDSQTRKKRGRWICRGLISQSRDKKGDTRYIMDHCDQNENIFITPSKLLEKKQQLKAKRKTEEIITPADNDPKWLYANYTGFIKDYDGIDVYVVMNSDTRN